MKIALCQLAAMPLSRNVVAEPFRTDPDGRAVPLPSLAAAGAELAERFDEAEIAALPAAWHAYQAAGLEAEAHGQIRAAGEAGLHCIVWVNGDTEIDFPFPNVVQFQHAVQRSRRRAGAVRTYPPFHDDVLDILFDGEVAPRPREQRPSVGFCGQGDASRMEEVKRVGIKVRQRFRRWGGRAEQIPEPWASHVRLRRRVLDLLDADPRVRTDFVIRTAYRAGMESKEDRRNPAHPLNRAFFENIRGTDYTVCPRGGGNFSARLSETLCMGRLPIVIDTDGLLPWPDHEIWRTAALVVPGDRLAELPALVVAHHAEVDDAGHRARQVAARQFWVERFSHEGFFRHLPEAVEPFLVRTERSGPAA